jgi:hypothetical protein
MSKKNQTEVEKSGKNYVITAGDFSAFQPKHQDLETNQIGARTQRPEQDLVNNQH